MDTNKSKKNSREIYDNGNTKDKTDSKPVSKSEKHHKNSNMALILTAISVCILFVSMSLFMVIFAKNNKMEMFDNSYNSYSYRLAKEYLRGKIYSSDGQLLAYSEGEDASEQKRVYPYGNMFAHAVGISSHGKMGTEKLANYYLLNCNLSLKDKADSEKEDEVPTADSVYTTLDTRLQQVAFDSLGVYKGAVVITEVKTGRILAMVSKPDFDPNNIDNEWDSLVADKNNSNLLNRVTQGLYPPGSTFKIITTLEYLREHDHSYAGYHFNCGGKFSYEDTTISCYHGSVHGSVDFPTSFAKSCNSSFANMATGFDPASYEQTLVDLMFDCKLPCDLPTSVSKTAIEPGVDMHNLLQASIGQGQDAMSPIHLNMITCAIANEGVLMRPMLLDHVESDSGNNKVVTFESKKEKQLITKEESELLTELMTEVVKSGTGKRLQNDLYTSAGKTGSAEYSNYNKDYSHAWFTGFAPAEEPQIAVTIIIEGAGSGGEYAVPIAKRMFDVYFTQVFDTPINSE